MREALRVVGVAVLTRRTQTREAAHHISPISPSRKGTSVTRKEKGVGEADDSSAIPVALFTLPVYPLLVCGEFGLGLAEALRGVG